MKNTRKLIKILAITNIITVIALFVLSYFLYINFRNDLVNVETNGDTGVKVTNLEMYLRKAGLVDGETSRDDINPYSLEQMEEFQKYYDKK